MSKLLLLCCAEAWRCKQQEKKNKAYDCSVCFLLLRQIYTIFLFAGGVKSSCVRGRSLVAAYQCLPMCQLGLPAFVRDANGLPRPTHSLLIEHQIKRYGSSVAAPRCTVLLSRTFLVPAEARITCASRTRSTIKYSARICVVRLPVSHFARCPVD